jgi:hypothetical protein
MENKRKTRPRFKNNPKMTENAILFKTSNKSTIGSTLKKDSRIYWIVPVAAGYE